MNGASIRAAVRAVDVPEATIASVRRSLAATVEGRRVIARLTDLHGGRAGPALAAFDRMSERLVRRVLAGYGEHVAEHAARIEAHLGALLDDLDLRRRGEAATRSGSARLADLEALSNSAREMQTLESYLRRAAAEPEGVVLTGVRHDVNDELRDAIDDIIAAVDSADWEAGTRTTRTGSVRVQHDPDAARAFATGQPSTTAPTAPRRERTVRDSDRLARDRERAGRTDVQVSPTDPRLARLDPFSDLPIRREDYRRHRADGCSHADAAGRARRDALERVRLVVGRTIEDAGPLRRHWDEVRTRLLAGRTPEQIGSAGMLDLYPQAQGQFWLAVAADPHAVAWLAARGLEFQPGSRAAVIRTNGNRALPIEEVRISLDHLAEKAVGDNWRRALDADNLELIPAGPNTAREVEQVRQGIK